MRLALLVALACSCKGNADHPPAPSEPPKPAPVADAAAAKDARCATPCLFLDKTPLADIASAFEQACGAPWPAAADADCGQLDYQRNCIYAASGYTFKRKKWSTAFGKLAWYVPRAEFKEADLSAVARANVAALKQRASECRRALPSKLVDAWLGGLAKGAPQIPALAIDLSSDQPEKISAKEMTERVLAVKDHLKPGKPATKSTPSALAKAAFPGKHLDAFAISDDDCGDSDEECGGTVFTLVFDGGTLVAIEHMMAACPVVYSLAEVPVREGEILRNLDRPSLEQTRSLRIATRQCGGTARYRIAEEKPEVTSLDEVVLVVDGVELSPDACATADLPYCANDGRALELARGEHLDLAFTIPPGSACRSVELRANGHYVR